MIEKVINQLAAVAVTVAAETGGLAVVDPSVLILDIFPLGESTDEAAADASSFSSWSRVRLRL